MENGFGALEDKVHKAAALVRTLREENKSHQEEIGRLRTRLQEAEKAASGAERTKGASPDEAKKLDAATRELQALRKEREEIRGRIAKMVQILDTLA